MLHFLSEGLLLQVTCTELGWSPAWITHVWESNHPAPVMPRNRK